jgi:DNA polymerase-3 subunit epsilon
MEFAIVDIETTGSHAASNGITEIAIIIHDGEKELDRFHSLVNPHRLIPRYVESLTGITNEMVQSAPDFSDIAPRVFEFLQGRVFVAHNVGFDFSFVKFQLEGCGYTLKGHKLCTVRLSRRVFPGFPSYSLGNLCKSLRIPVRNRHRAIGDAEATAILWEKMWQHPLGRPTIQEYLGNKKNAGTRPLFLEEEEIEQLPSEPGVYYFLDEKNTVVYVGKAIDIKARVKSHFSGTSPAKQRQEFIRNVYRIKYVPVPNELMAFLLEAAEIQRLWPKYNRSMKRPIQKFGLYGYYDTQGYHRLIVEKIIKGHRPFHSFNLIQEGRNWLQSLTQRFALCPVKNFLPPIQKEGCPPSCSCHLPPSAYNEILESALKALTSELPSFALLSSVPTTYPYIRKWQTPEVKKKSEGLFSAAFSSEIFQSTPIGPEEVSSSSSPKGEELSLGGKASSSSSSSSSEPAVFNSGVAAVPVLKSGEPSLACILMEKGVYYGMGYIPAALKEEPESWKAYLKMFPDNDYVRGLILKHAALHPECVLPI